MQSYYSHEQLGLEPMRHAGITMEERIPPTYNPNQVPEPPLPQRRRFAKPARGMRSQGFSRVQTVCRVFAMLISLAIIGLLARVLALYYATHNYKVMVTAGLVTSAWPPASSTVLLPTYLLLSAAVITCLSGLLAAICSMARFKKNRSNASTGHILTAVLPLTVFGLFIAALAVFRLVDLQNGPFGWSCSHRDVETVFDGNEVGLGQVCDTMSAAWYMGIAVALLELVTVVAIVTAARSGKPSTGRRGYSELGPKGNDEF